MDQGARSNLFPGVVEQGMGLIIKRPIGNAVWGWATDPNPYHHMLTSYTEEYFRRAGVMSSQAERLKTRRSRRSSWQWASH